MVRACNVAIIGTGKIGTDLLAKILKSSDVKCLAFIGRREDSPGVQFALMNKVPVVLDGYEILESMRESIDWVIDATSAKGHAAMMPNLLEWKYKVIDMTPSGIGDPYSPLISSKLRALREFRNVNLMTCGAQVSAPFAHAVGALAEIEYIESIANLSSDSVGAATRINLDEYIEITETALTEFSGARQAKAIIVINPAIPPITMKVTIMVKFAGAGPTESDCAKIFVSISEVLSKFKQIIPGMEFQQSPNFEEQVLKIDLLVAGSGDFLPKHSGNLDVLTSTALWLIRDTIQKAG